MEQRHQELVSAVEMQGSPMLVSSKQMRIPGRTLAVLNVQSNVKEIDTGQIDRLGFMGPKPMLLGDLM